MSWWNKHKKEAGLLAAAIAGTAATAASGGTAAPLFAGLFGEAGAAGAAGAGVGLGEALAASQGVGQAGLAKGGLEAALAAENGSEMGLAGTKAISDAYFGSAAPVVQKTAGLLGNFGGKNAGTAMMGANLLAGGMQPQQPQPMAPPPPPAQPMPKSNFAGYGDAPPPGIDPMMWAQLPDEIKRQFRAQRGQA